MGEAGSRRNFYLMVRCDLADSRKYLAEAVYSCLDVGRALRKEHVLQDNLDALKQAEAIMMDAIHDAIRKATDQAEVTLQSLGLQNSSRAYLANIAMRRLFLHLCGADEATAKGGDPELAWDILYIGRGTARYWERERETEPSRHKPQSNADVERERRDKSALAQSAKRFVTDTAIRALIEHASMSDPALRNRIAATVEARASASDPLSQVEQDFAESAKMSMKRLIGENP